MTNGIGAGVGSEPLDRDEWLAHADGVLTALEPYQSPGGALILPPGRPSRCGPRGDGLEGFARSFLLAAVRLAAPGSTPPPERLLERYLTGLRHGPDPAHPEWWPRPADHAQAVVEAASIAIGLHLAPEFWRRLPDRDRQRLADWLGAVRGVRTSGNNWVMFKTVVSEFLAGVGAEYSASDIHDGLARVDELYRGDGWYADGDGQAFDHYIGWAMHFYPALWSRMALGRVPTAAAQWRARSQQRLRLFVPQLVRTFGSDGGPLYQGRSLTYRHATLASLWIAELVDAQAIPPALTRSLSSATLRYFDRNGAFAPDGTLTLGWRRAHLPTIQFYSGPGSPYWAAKGYFGLLLGPEHPVWAAASAPGLPDEPARVLPVPGWVTNRADGIARIANHGSDHQPPLRGIADPFYARLSYSSGTGVELLAQAGLDNHIGVLDADGRSSLRTQIVRIPSQAEQEHQASWHRPVDHHGRPWPVRIATVAGLCGGLEVRLHLLVADTDPAAGDPRVGRGPAGPPDELTIEEGGFAVAGADGAVGSLGERVARAASGRLTATIRALEGKVEPLVVHHSGGNAFGEYSAVPVLRRRWDGHGSIALGTVVGLMAGDRSEGPGIVAEVTHRPRAGARLAAWIGECPIVLTLPPPAQWPAAPPLVVTPRAEPEEAG